VGIIDVVRTYTWVSRTFCNMQNQFSNTLQDKKLESWIKGDARDHFLTIELY
jgi:hypothetical protein